MNIFAVAYENIWPFPNKKISINFRSWKYLIKSSVGTWKSFLFFDWPVYWLYKYSSRPVLNKKSQNWFIKILFEQDWVFYFIKRQIKATKSGWESVSSSLYTINANLESVSDSLNSMSDVLNFDMDFSDHILDLEFEHIQFKLEQELQKTLETLIPPRQVFLNTNFLMQEWENIFDLTPVDRINVFKNIFNLVWIDDAKETIQQEKKEIQLKLKLKKDTSNFDSKLRNYINSILDLLDKDIKSNLSEDNLNYLEDIIFVKDSICILDFDFQESFLDNIINQKEKLDKEKEKYQKYVAEIESLDNQKSETSKNIDDINKTIFAKNKEYNELNNKIKNIDPKKMDELKTQKELLENEQKLLLKKVDFDYLKSIWYEVDTIYQVNDILQELIYKWKELRSKQESLSKEMLMLDEKYSTLNSKLSDLEIKEWTYYYDLFQEKKINLLSNLQNEVSNIETRIKSFEEKIKNYDEISLFADKLSNSADKILLYTNKIYDSNKDNEFAKDLKEELDSINELKGTISKSFTLLDTSKTIENLQNEKIELERKIADLQKNSRKYFEDFFTDLEEKKKEINNEIKNLNYDKKKSEIYKSKENIEKELNWLSEIFKKVERKNFKEIYEKYLEYDEKIKKTDKEISLLQWQIDEIQSYKEKLSLISAEIDSLKKQNKENENKKLEIEKRLEDKKSQFEFNDISLINNRIEKLDNIKTYIYYIQDLIWDFKKQQLEVNKLKEDEKIINDLYWIFSKELMLIVLEDFLPQIEDIMNSYLSQVVDYQIKFDLVKKSNDKLELDINILDKLGIRPVKSLSWGQRTILKLVWIMSVSSLLKTKFLFLDETINNLDFDTIGKVSSLIEDFVHMMDMKFYVVTHSTQIQEMDIWDWEVHIK